MSLKRQGLEDDGPDLALFVLESKVHMTGCGPAQVRYLSFHPEDSEIILQEALDIFIQLRNCKNYLHMVCNYQILDPMTRWILIPFQSLN
jgi:hypothetical protein